jgi:hypothetical protein
MSERVDKAKKNLDKAVKIVAILGIAAIAFAIWFSIQFAKSKTKQEFDKRQTYFNDIHTNFKKDWALNAYWDSLNVEKSVYYNEQNANEISVSISKQTFNDQFNVKTDVLERPDLYKVLNYSIKQTIADSTLNANMIYLCMNPLVLHKMTVAAVDSRGLTYKSYFNNKSVITLKYDSYKDKEGIGEKVFEKDVMMFEQLPFSLRSIDFENAKVFKLKVVEPQLSSGTGKFKTKMADVKVNKLADQYSVNVEFSIDSVCNYVFEKTYPNKLVSFKLFDQSYQLKK